MSIPNSAAKNAMTDTERTIYNWGLEDGKDWYQKVGKTEEQLRILDLITNSDFGPSVKTDLRKLIKEIEDTHPETDFGKPEGKES